MTVRIVADENMPNIEAWFSSVASSITRKPGRTLTRADLSEADVLLVRSVTKVHEELLQQTPVRFVGSATIGTDHIDQTYLNAQNIPFHYAPGCNAQSVADWLLSVLSRLHLDHDLHWWQKTIGIVGVGNVGKTVQSVLERLGCRVLLCDPPRHERGELPEHRELSELLSLSDIVCFHTPHTVTGKHPTDKLVCEFALQTVRPETWLINAGRGPVFDRDALLEAIEHRNLRVVLDVWPEEPEVDQSLLDAVLLASPHVAGYSLEGKFKGTEMLARALQQWAGWAELTAPEPPAGAVIDARLYEQDDSDRWISELILAVYDPARDTVAMRQSVLDGFISAPVFDELRKSYPTRREIGSTRIEHAEGWLAERLKNLGFQVGVK